MNLDYNITYRQKDKGLQVIISYKDDLGKWKQKSKQGFPNTREGKKKAKTWADEALQQIKLTSSVPIELDDISFKEFVEIHKKSISLRVSYSTLQGYDTALAHFNSLNDIKIKKITSTHIQSCVDDMLESRLNPSTIKVYLQKINIFFNEAILQNLITKNPTRNIKYYRDKSDNKKIALTENQEAILLKNLNNKKYYLISLMALKTGARLGEILGLTWNDIDFTNNTITINKQWNLNDDGIYTFVDVKGKNSNRIIPMPLMLKTTLKEFKNKKMQNIDNRIFSYHNTASTSSNLIREYKKIGFDISVHELRHTYATKLISNGIDFKTAATLLGHSVEMTLNVYSHVTDDMIKKATNIINSNF